MVWSINDDSSINVEKKKNYLFHVYRNSDFYYNMFDAEQYLLSSFILLFFHQFPIIGLNRCFSRNSSGKFINSYFRNRKKKIMKENGWNKATSDGVTELWYRKIKIPILDLSAWDFRFIRLKVQKIGFVFLQWNAADAKRNK